MNKIQIDKTNGIEINLYPHQSEIAILIIHGASEGASRYIELATALNEKYNVITYNHPGHETGQAVDFESTEILEKTKTVLKYVQANFNQVVIFAHSMGTFVIRNLLNYVNDNTKIILSGAPVINWSDKLSSQLAIVALKFTDKDRTSLKLNQIVFDQKSDKRGLKEKAWLSSKPEVVDKFRNSELHNQPFTNRAISNLLQLTLSGTQVSVYQKLAGYDLMLVSGGADPFTNNGLNYRYITKYAKQADLKIYDNSHHEVHNDVDKEQLINDIIKFIEKGTNGKN